jgi:hypothetical protein
MNASLFECGARGQVPQATTLANLIACRGFTEARFSSFLIHRGGQDRPQGPNRRETVFGHR